MRVVVYTKTGRITRAFRKLYELCERMADYPVLDESDFSRREWEEYEASWRNGAASDMRRAVKDKFKLSQFAGYCLDEADEEQMREWFESFDPNYTYEDTGSGPWPAIDHVIRDKMGREDVARFLREIRARLRAAV